MASSMWNFKMKYLENKTRYLQMVNGFDIYGQIHINEILVYMYVYIERKAYCIFNFLLIRNFMIQ